MFSVILAALSQVWTARSRWISSSALVVLAFVAVLPRLLGPVHWSPDGLFYQAQMYELQGDSQAVALHRAFTSDAAREVARSDSRVHDPAWVKYSERFYRRRWLVPALAAALFPIAGDRSLLDASLLGYICIGPLLFLLLRKRFSPGLSLAVAGACLLLPPLREAATHPETDSWGLALEVWGLLVALLAMERGGRWIGLWIACMLALSFTRDTTVVLLFAVGWIAITTRTRRGAAVLATGIAACIPSPMLFGAPLVQLLSYEMQGFRIPHPASWSYVVTHYPATIYSVLHEDAAYPKGLSFPLMWYMVGAMMLAAIAFTLFASSHRDPFFMLYRGALVGAAAVVALAAVDTGMRLELAFVPCLAAALAYAGQRLLTRRATATSARMASGGSP